jgi:rhomboid family GlyGly-CTERM serine protease
VPSSRSGVPSSAEVDATARTGGAAWLLLATVLAAGACIEFASDAPLAFDWQPALAEPQPWRAWSAAWVHYSALHLGANLVGCLLVALLGWVARVPRRAALAWFFAWPLTQLGLLLRPDLLHYGGLSGVLHAGAVVVAVHLLSVGPATRRWVGGGVLAGVAIKVFLEAPWGEALRHPAGWDIAVAPFAHLSGSVAGVVMACLAERLRRRPLTIDRND